MGPGYEQSKVTALLDIICKNSYIIDNIIIQQRNTVENLWESAPRLPIYLQLDFNSFTSSQ